MLSLLNNANFFSQYGLLIVLVFALVVLMFISFNRRKKEDAYRNELVGKIVPGTLIKTYYGLYGKVVRITETTDGRILLIETGEGDRVSYQSIHINAVYGIDEKQEVTLDENGLPVEDEKETKTESELKFEELEKQLAQKEVEAKLAEEKKETEDTKAEVKAEPKKSTRSTTAKKSTSSTKSTTKKTTSK